MKANEYSIRYDITALTATAGMPAKYVARISSPFCACLETIRNLRKQTPITWTEDVAFGYAVGSAFAS